MKSLLKRESSRETRVTSLNQLVHDVIEQAAPLRHELDQPAPRVVVLCVRLEVLGQVRNALRKHRHLHIGRASIALLGAILGNQFFLAFSRDRHTVIQFQS